MSQAARRAAGSKPVVGSSRKRMLRIADQAEREVEAPLLPAGERLHARDALLREADELDHLVHVAGRSRSSRRTAATCSRTVRFGYMADDWRTMPMRSRQALAVALRVVRRARSPRPRRGAGSPRGSRRSSSCRRRSGRAVRRPRPRRSRSSRRAAPRRCRTTCEVGDRDGRHSIEPRASGRSTTGCATTVRCSITATRAYCGSSSPI